MYWWWIVDIIHTCIHRYTTIEQVLWHWSSWFSIDITCSFVSVHQSNINHKHAAFIAHGYWSNMCWTLFIHYNSCDVRLLCKPMINALSNVYDAWLFDMWHYMALHIIYAMINYHLDSGHDHPPYVHPITCISKAQCPTVRIPVWD